MYIRRANKGITQGIRLIDLKMSSSDFFSSQLSQQTQASSVGNNSNNNNMDLAELISPADNLQIDMRKHPSGIIPTLQ